MISIVKATEARIHFGEMIKRAYRGEEHLIIEKGGIPVVAIISVKDYERFRRALAVEQLEKMGQVLGEEANERAISEKHLDRIVEEVKEEIYQERYGQEG